MYASPKSWPPSPRLRPASTPHHIPRFRFRFRTLALSILTTLTIYFLLPTPLRPFYHEKHGPSLRYRSVDWSRYAYSQYATSSPYLCNSIMVFEALQRLGSKADRILLYPKQMDLEVANSTDRDSQLLVMARDRFGVKLVPVEVQKVRTEKKDRAGETWDSSITKFLAFNQTQYDRILHFDSDVTVLNHMDELFLLPGAQVAMLRAYWHLPKLKTLTSLFVLLEPSEFEFGRLSEVASARKENEYDMEIMDHLYGDSAMVLPHRQYGLLSGEFRSRVHANFLGNDYEPWDPERVLEEASLVHFSDWPLPKPWISWPGTLVSQMVPRCKEIGGVVNGDCRDKDIWLGLYSDFRARRKDICALLPAPAPEWPPGKLFDEKAKATT
ncbi:N-acetylglucosaminyltransferase [Hypocenomyce scalaris]|nr:N-acetylglucosaminyltransferase [Hypocenomyce scalaris]